MGVKMGVVGRGRGGDSTRGEGAVVGDGGISRGMEGQAGRDIRDLLYLLPPIVQHASAPTFYIDKGSRLLLLS